MSSTFRIANRVSQIEARQLDHELGGMVDNVVEQLEIPSFSEELKTILKLYLFTNDVMTASSPGMRVYNTSYCDAAKYVQLGDTTHPAKRKLLLLAAMNLVGAYLTRRYEMFEKIIGGSILTKMDTPWFNLDNATLLVKFLNVINFLAFLKKGMYLSIPERILGIAPALSDENYYSNVQFNQMQMSYMYREMVWRALAEFLSTAIPFINIEQIKNKFSRFPSIMHKRQSELSLSDKMAKESNSKKCAICSQQPFNPYVIGCRHVFCYYCLQSQYSVNPSNGYICSTCEYKTFNEDDLQRYKVIGALG